MALLPTLPWLLALGFVSGMLFGPVNPIVNTVMQKRSPEVMRGRVLGVFTSSAYAAGPLGLLIVGPLVDAVGVQRTFMGLALATTVLAVAAIGLRGLRDLDEPAASEPKASKPVLSGPADMAPAGSNLDEAEPCDEHHPHRFGVPECRTSH